MTAIETPTKSPHTTYLSRPKHFRASRLFVQTNAQRHLKRKRPQVAYWGRKTANREVLLPVG